MSVTYTNDNEDRRYSLDSPYVRLGGHNCYSTIYRPGKASMESKLWKLIQCKNNGYDTASITKENAGSNAYVKILAKEHVRTDRRFGLISRNFHLPARSGGVGAYIFSIYAIASSYCGTASIKVEKTDGTVISIAPVGYDSSISTSTYSVTEVRVLNPRIPYDGLDVRLVIEIDTPTAFDYICLKYVLFGEVMTSIVGDNITMSYGDRTLTMSFNNYLSHGQNSAAGTVTEFATSITANSRLIL